MKILFISASPLEYSSSANIRNLALLKGLKELNNDIYTLTPMYQKNMTKYDESICNFNFKGRYWIKIGKFNEKITLKKGKKNFVKKMIYKTLSKFRVYDFKTRLLSKVNELNINEKFDYIISSSDPKSSHLFAEQLIKNNPDITKKWIQYWGDPFAYDINKNSLIPKFVIKKEEERLLSLADKIVYVSPFTFEKQKNIYSKYCHKMQFLPIPFFDEKIYEKSMNEKIVLGYYGDYNTKDRNIIPLYNTVKNNTNGISLNIFGASNLNLKKCGNIEIKERQRADIINEYEKNTDILICLCNKKGTQIPGKVYHYAATNKPILIILDGNNKQELKLYFERFGRYVICQNKEKSINEAILNITKEKQEYEPLEALKPQKIAKKFIEE